MGRDNLNLERLLEEAKEFHGDLCAGIALGTRMSILGLSALGIDDPKGEDRKKLIVYVETDRCASDAILSVTGCHPGKRSMKILDYGKMAATFIDIETGRAVRVTVKETDMGKGPGESLVDDYVAAPAEELFQLEEVAVDLRPEDMPGKPLRVVNCSACGERVMDMREVMKDGKVLCRPCAEGKRYYRRKEG